MLFDSVIEGLGRSGDGLVRHEGQSFYIPGTLPGEKLRIRLTQEHGETHAECHEVLTISPERAVPPCNLFGDCGGCALQHMQPSAMMTWKIDLVRRGLHAASFTTLPEPKTFQAPPQTRRRMDFALQRVKGGVILGLHQRNGAPVDLTDCVILHPDILTLLPPLREILSQLGALTGCGGLKINLLDSGPDMTLQTPTPLSPSDKSKLAAFAKDYRVPRITWQPGTGQQGTGHQGGHGMETLVQWGKVVQYFANIPVSPPSGCFLQASKEAENAIIQAVLSGLPSLKRKDRIYELYAGCGTLTFPLAEKGQVRAWEGDAAALAALKTATCNTKAEGFLRDLNRQPLLPQDLKEARVLVLDPPYQGGGKQMPHIARSSITDVIYVSCNPQALTKDLALLQKAGFVVIDWTVIDQFLWSTGIESVISLSRDAKRVKKAALSRLSV